MIHKRNQQRRQRTENPWLRGFQDGMLEEEPVSPYRPGTDADGAYLRGFAEYRARGGKHNPGHYISKAKKSS